MRSDPHPQYPWSRFPSSEKKIDETLSPTPLSHTTHTTLTLNHTETTGARQATHGDANKKTRSAFTTAIIPEGRNIEPVAGLRGIYRYHLNYFYVSPFNEFISKQTR